MQVPSTVSAAKRARTPSQSSETSSNSSRAPHKASRLAPGASFSSTVSNSSDSTVIPGESTTHTSSHPLLCTLPPTCNRHPTPIANTNDLERHYATYHAHVCEVKGCGCVFPDARLLELHQTECHDPLAGLRKDRGEKIFQCHLPAPTCGRDFLTPKARRLHLIQVHAFPKEYFFAVTNKGVGGLLKKWGEGASLIRKEWRAREETEPDDMGSHRNGHENIDDDDDDDEEEEEEEEEQSQDIEEGEEEFPADLEATPRMVPRNAIHSPPSSSPSRMEVLPRSKRNNRNKGRHEDPAAAMDDSTENDLSNLASSMNSLSLVPNSIRFGRGGKGGAFLPRAHHYPRGQGSRRGKHNTHQGGGDDVMDVDVNLIGKGAAAGGGGNLGTAGRGRAGIVGINRGGVSRGKGRGRGGAEFGAENGVPARARGRGQRGRGGVQIPAQAAI